MSEHTSLNPFVWGRPILDIQRIVRWEDFPERVALMLKAQTNVAIFGARDTGKTTFLTVLEQALVDSKNNTESKSQQLVVIDLERATSLAGFIACIQKALKKHPDRNIRKGYLDRVKKAEKEYGFSFKGLSARKRNITETEDAEILGLCLEALVTIDQPLVIAFDEFQTLSECKGEPLRIIRSSLMGIGADHISVLVTGSVRHALEMMLDQSNQRLFQEVHRVDLPPLGYQAFYDFLEANFSASDKTIDSEALELILEITDAHPKRTQELAWTVWEAVQRTVTISDVNRAWERMMRDAAKREYTQAFKLLSSDSVKLKDMLIVLAEDRPPFSRANERLFSIDRGNIGTYLERLERIGYAQEGTEGWYIIDPLFKAWIETQSPYYEE